MSENLDKIGSILDIFSYDSTSTLQPNLSFFFAFSSSVTLRPESNRSRGSEGPFERAPRLLGFKKFMRLTLENE